MNSSRKRSIITPRPSAVALIQASYNEFRPPSSRRMKCRTKPHFSTELADQVDDQLARSQNDFEKHQIYRNAFSSIIEKYSNYSDSMNFIKNGYEGLIDQFSNEIEENELRNEQIMKSQNEFVHLIDTQKQELETKKQNYTNLSIQTEEQIQLLIEDINDITQRLAEGKVALKDEDYFTRQQYFTFRECNEKSARKENKAKLINSNYDQLKEDETNLKLAIENHQSMISKTLDEIFNKNRAIKNSQKNIDSLQEEIERENCIVEKKREKLKELEEKNKYFTDSISNYNNKIQEINDDNSSIKNYLQAFMKQKNEENIEIDDPIRLTERFVSGLRPKRNVIDVAT